MATIKSALVLNDRMTAVLRTITRALDACVTGLENVESAGAEAFDPEAARQMRIAIDEANARLGEIETDYQRAAAGQQNLNRQMQRGVGLADSLGGKIQGLAAGYLSLQSVKAVVRLSDEMTQTRARINLMNDGLQTTDALMNDIFQAAQRARGGYTDMAAVVAKFGNNAPDAFGNSQEVVKFAELVQKQMKIAGASGAEASNATLQLSQALGSGVLRGDELNSIFEQAPNLIQAIADYMGKPIGQMRDLASEGKITADIVKNAMFAAADDINAKFNDLPMTWGDVWAQFKNNAEKALQPVLNEINRLANDENAIQLISRVTTAIAIVANESGKLLRVISNVYDFFAENWTTIAPIVLGVASVLGVFELMLHATEIAQFAAAAAAKVHELGQRALGIAILFANSNLLIGLTVVAAVVAAIVAVCAHIAKTSDVAKSTFGVIMGGLNVAWQALIEFGKLVLNIGNGIGGAIEALCQNIGAAFHNAIFSVKGWFYGLLSTALNVIAGIAEALNKLPFVNFDFSGITGKAAEYAQKAADAKADKQEYKNIADAYNANSHVFDAFSDGWAKNAFASGAAWGDGVTEKVTGKLNELKEKFTSGLNIGEIGGAGGIGGTLGAIKDDTGSIVKGLDITDEELKWLREIAEREAVNRFTTAEIKVDMSGMNNSISSDMDVDGVIAELARQTEAAMRTVAAGVH